jgi:hypothetical protein
MSFSGFHSVMAFGLGFLAVLAHHAAAGWWLNSGPGVVRATVILSALGAGSGIWRPNGTWHRACALWAGAAAASAAVLFSIGPGNLWPVVLAIAAGISFAAVFAGAAVGFAIGKRRNS